MKSRDYQTGRRRKRSKLVRSTAISRAVASGQKRKKPLWRKVQVGPTANVYAKPIDDKILMAMPESSKTFLDVGLIGRFKDKLKGIVSTER